MSLIALNKLSHWLALQAVSVDHRIGIVLLHSSHEREVGMSAGEKKIAGVCAVITSQLTVCSGGSRRLQRSGWR